MFALLNIFRVLEELVKESKKVQGIFKFHSHLTYCVYYQHDFINNYQTLTSNLEKESLLILKKFLPIDFFLNHL